MFKILVRPQVIKRFCHTHSKSSFSGKNTKNNHKKIEDLIDKQNNILNHINLSLFKMSEDLNSIKFWTALFGFIIAIKPS